MPLCRSIGVDAITNFPSKAVIRRGDSSRSAKAQVRLETVVFEAGLGGYY